MFFGRTSSFSRGALPLAFAASFAVPMIAAGQTPAAPSVYVNPRAAADDPRIGLKPGMFDAGEAAMGLQKLAALPKPPVFDPPPPPDPPAGTTPPGGFRFAGNGLTYANSDLAFGGKHLFVGNFYGINFYDISDPAKIKLLTSLVCPGGQGDVSVYGNLLFMSVEAASGRIDCGTQGIPLPAGYTPPPPPPPPAPGAPPTRPARAPEVASPDRFRGVRIFDISDITKPKQVADVQTCRGSHTHTLLVDPKDKDNVYIYVAGSAGVRSPEELAGCTGKEDDPNTALFTIVIIKVPVAHPELAKVVNSPYIFSDPQTGNINGLWKGGSHGEGTQTTSSTRGCHDITMFASLGLAAGACSGNGILLNIKDPVHPIRIDAVNDPNYAFWHSANFSNDGTKVLFTDEWGGGVAPRCRASDPMQWGADAIFRLKDNKLTLASYYKMPAPQTEVENCVAHNGSMIPIPGRDVMVQSWYQGGVSIVDFTDAEHPIEVGYFDRGPVDPEKHIIGGQWSTYWYNGYIYGSEIARGVDVFQLVPTTFITQHEIDAAKLVQVAALNVQNQEKFTWPSNFVVAHAYVDQLARGTSVTTEQIVKLNEALEKAETSHTKGRELKALAASLEKSAGAAKTQADGQRMRALAAILK